MTSHRPGQDREPRQHLSRTCLQPPLADHTCRRCPSHARPPIGHALPTQQTYDLSSTEASDRLDLGHHQMSSVYGRFRASYSRLRRRMLAVTNGSVELNHLGRNLFSLLPPIAPVPSPLAGMQIYLVDLPTTASAIDDQRHVLLDGPTADRATVFKVPPPPSRIRRCAPCRTLGNRPSAGVAFLGRCHPASLPHVRIGGSRKALCCRAPPGHARGL